MLQGGSGLSIPALVSHCYEDPNCMTSSPSRQYCPPPPPQNGFHSGRTLQDIMYPSEMPFPGFMQPDPRGNQGLQPSWNPPPWTPRQNMPFLAHPHPGDPYQYGYGEMSDYSDDSNSYAQKRKRARTAFSAEQLKKLEKRFQANHYIVGEERQKIAKDLDLSEAQVKVWFQNRRTKFKRDEELERLGRKKKRKGEHHIRKWQITTRHFGPETNELFPDPDSDSEDKCSN